MSHFIFEIYIVQNEGFEFILIHQTIRTELAIDFIRLLEGLILSCEQSQKCTKSLPRN